MIVFKYSSFHFYFNYFRYLATTHSLHKKPLAVILLEIQIHPQLISHVCSSSAHRKANKLVTIPLSTSLLTAAQGYNDEDGLLFLPLYRY